MRKIRNRRIVLYALALGLVLLGGRKSDIGRLHPVEVVHLYEEKGILILETDTGDKGWGLTVEQALERLKETTPGVVYLDTADYLLLGEGMEPHLPALRAYLKKGTVMAYAPEGIDLEEAAAYLRVHEPERTIKEWEEPGEWLGYEGGKMILKKCQKT